MRLFWVVMCLIACGDDAISPPDAEPDALEDMPQSVELELAAPPAQPGFSLHGGDGQLWVRSSRGLYSSADGGATWNRLFQDATASGGVEIASDGTVIVARLRGAFPTEQVMVERHETGAEVPLALPASFPAPGRWTGATFALDGQTLYASAYGRSDNTTAAPAQMFVSTNRGDTFAPLAPPAGTEDNPSWLLEACQGVLAAVGIQSAHALRGGTWETLVAGQVSDVQCLADGTLLVATLETTSTRIHRVRWDGGTRSETSTVLPGRIELAVGAGASVFAVDAARTAMFESSDGGASFAPRAVTAPKSNAVSPGVVATNHGVWSLIFSLPTVLPPGETTWRLAGLPGPGELSFAIDVGELGTTRFAAIYQDAYDGGAAGYLLFASDDAGTTWQFVTFVAVAITCMDVDEPGIFFGGAGDVAGAGWAIHDPTGATVLKQSRVSDGQDSVAVDQPIVACDWLPAGQQSTIFIAQTSNEVLPESRLRTHNPWGPFDRWDRYPYFPAEPFRITALDLQQQHSRVLTAFEHLMLGPGGYGVRAYRGVLPLQTGDPMGEEVDPYAMTPGARAAIQLDGDIALYPDGRVVIGLFEAELVGLPNRTTITSARADANRTLWLSTADGLFRSKEPIR